MKRTPRGSHYSGISFKSQKSGKSPGLKARFIRPHAGG
jgi:hypothetical protein